MNKVLIYLLLCILFNIVLGDVQSSVPSEEEEKLPSVASEAEDSTSNDKSTDTEGKSTGPNPSPQNSNSTRNSTETNDKDGAKGMKISLILLICLFII